jgi:hypothetical protein
VLVQIEAVENFSGLSLEPLGEEFPDILGAGNGFDAIIDLLVSNEGFSYLVCHVP